MHLQGRGEGMNKARIFFGIPIDEQHVDLFKTEIARENAKLLAEGKWTKPGNFHITLQFIGDVTKNSIPELINSVEKTINSEVSFSVPFLKIDAFPENRPRMVAVYVSLNPPLANLYSLLTRATNLVGFPPESRAYLPHITLMRSTDHRSLTMISIPLQNYNTQVKEVILYESVAEQGGSVYVPLHRFKLR